jgi:heat shock protein HslJ/uncharacterized membrane protein
MDARTLAVVFISALAVTACERTDKSQPAAAPVAESAPAANQVPAQAGRSFVNKVWEVTESPQVERGSLRVFLADGTLVLASPNATPAFGIWRFDDGRLTIIEEGLEYPTDILALSESEFRIRMHSPGEPVEIRFAPAKQTPPGAVASAMQANVAIQAEVEPAAVPLWGTAWRLEGRAQATLEFPSEGRASGNGSCNRFNGVVTVEGDTIQFGGIAATRKACADAVMRQEDAYFAALRDAERFEVDGESLRIHTAGREEPLRFVTAEAPAGRPAAQGIQAVPATETPALSGIWTVVAHHIPGVSAMGDAGARTHYGETVRLTESSAISPGASCREPRYTSNRVSAEQYLASEYRLPRGSLKPLAAKSQIQLMKVSCGGALWTALGGLLLEIDADRVLAPWDGVFFELARDRDFRGLGQEPGWQLEIRKGSEIRFTYDYGKGTAVTPAPAPQVDSSNGTRTYHAVAEANDLRVVIVPVSCTDSMSGRPFSATVSVTLNGKTFRGCGEELATPYQG